MKLRLTLALLSLIAFATCSSTTTSSPSTIAPASTTASTAAPAATPMFGDHGFVLAGMDANVKACDNFYLFAVGKWRESHPLPAQYSRFGRFEEVADRNRDILRTLVEADAAKSAAKGSLEQKVGDFYASCMDDTAIEAAGIQPIASQLARIDSIKTRDEVVAVSASLQQNGFASPLFRVGGTPDLKDSKMIIAGIGTGSLGLPDRDYYLRNDERFKKYRDQYILHVAKMLQLVGEDAASAQADAARVLQLETKLATATLPRAETRVPENQYHITTIAELNAMAPAIDWSAYLHAIDVNPPKINVAQPKYMQALSQALNDTPVDDWKAYLRWHLVNSSAGSLTNAIYDEDFDFNRRILSGAKEPQERWKRCVRSTDSDLGDLLGQEYVRKNFTPEAKKKMNEMIDNLVGALREDIPTLTWMGPETKHAALEKLNAFTRRIGYPDKWTDYSALDIDRSAYAKNVFAARRVARERNLSRIGKPDDPNEWGRFTPPTVNASYEPTRNHITFPAGILQPPFYDPNADDAYNYGGIGTVIGHEMTHGFDDSGAKFDATGNLRNWWTAEDLKNFEQRTNCIVNEYGEFNVAPGVNINGKLVTGEAIADLGGATLALRAYEKSLAGRQRKTIDGFTPEQRFFLGFAQVWAENMASEEGTRRALTDPHAQGPFRVNGTVQNMPEFAKAFRCDTGTKMVREESKRCSIW
jgi:putative endopeptidase